MAEGSVYFISKGEGPSDDIAKWRPITILNTIYKIVVKAVSVTLQPFLSDIIHGSDRSFLNERSIFDNICTFWISLVEARHLQRDLVILLLDFEKAYDRVEWSFLEGVL